MEIDLVIQLLEIARFFIKKGDYSESEVLEMFIEGIKTNFGFKNEEIVITNIINLEKIRRELEE